MFSMNTVHKKVAEVEKDIQEFQEEITRPKVQVKEDEQVMQAACSKTARPRSTI